MRRNKFTLFILELLLCLGSFAICAAVCVSLFVSAKQQSDHSRRLSLCLSHAQTTAEVFQSGAPLASLTSSEVTSQNGFTMSFSEAFDVAPDGPIALVATVEREPGLDTLLLTYTRYGQPLYTLSVCRQGEVTP